MKLHLSVWRAKPCRAHNSHGRVANGIADRGTFFEWRDFTRVTQGCITIRKHNKNEYWETDFYKKFIEKFYYDDKFNKIYNIWLDTKDSWKKPSIDHINCDNRSNDLNNFQFLTWFENRCKNNIPQSKWIKMKENINEYFI